VLACAVVVRVTAERTEPVTLALGGTVAVAVIVPGVLAVALAVDATEEHESCWEAHSSKLKPGSEKPTHAVN